jgi:hypothetical protein
MIMRFPFLPITIAAISLAVLGGTAISAQDKYSVQVPGGLAFSEIRGFESWQTISVSHNGAPALAVILGNPEMIAAYQAGFPGNGKPVPDGAKMAKIHWAATKNEKAPGQPIQAGVLNNVDVMVKDSKRFADSGGWGWAAFEYDSASDTFRPATTTDKPPQGNDAKCGYACHLAARNQDYVFTLYGNR